MRGLGSGGGADEGVAAGDEGAAQGGDGGLGGAYVGGDGVVTGGVNAAEVVQPALCLA